MEYDYNETQKEKKENHTGIPDNMKKQFEMFSALSFDDVRVHYNSKEPARLNALAYTQGTQVYIAPGQVRCLPHELGHVVQQKRGIVPATTRINGLFVNDSINMENKADEISRMAQNSRQIPKKILSDKGVSYVAQCYAIAKMTGKLEETTKTVYGKSGNRLGTKAVLEQFTRLNNAFIDVVYPKMLKHSEEGSEHVNEINKRRNDEEVLETDIKDGYIQLERAIKRACSRKGTDEYMYAEGKQKSIIDLNVKIVKIEDPAMKAMASSGKKTGICIFEDVEIIRNNMLEAINSDEIKLVNNVFAKWKDYWNELENTKIAEEIEECFFNCSNNILKTHSFKKLCRTYGGWVFRNGNYDELHEYLKQILKEKKIGEEGFSDNIIEKLMREVSKKAVAKAVISKEKKNSDDIKEMFKDKIDIIIGTSLGSISDEGFFILESIRKHKQIIEALKNVNRNDFVKSIYLNYQRVSPFSDMENFDRSNNTNTTDTYELRSPYHCAEPNALAVIMTFFSDKGMDKNENIYKLLDSIVIKVERYNDDTKVRENANMSPCPVCEQWVDENGKIKANLKNKFLTSQ